MSDIQLASTPLSRLRRSSAKTSNAPTERITSFFEFWPGWIAYTPIVLQWIALGIRYGNPILATAANPTIDAGGLCGESKQSILDQIAGPSRDWVASYTVCTSGAYAESDDLGIAEGAMRAAGLAYPVVVKPDIGCNGTGVCLVDNRADLARYLSAFPRLTRYMLQALIPHEGEAGVFYIRRPGEKTGTITSLTLKSSPVVVGDGQSNLRDLIMADPRCAQVPHLYLPRLASRLHEVPEAGERVKLVFVGNHCKGSTFKNGAKLISRELTERIDAIARSIPNFHFGRFDIRYDQAANLTAGEGFSIIEINGVGSEATHIWDPQTTLREAYAAQFFHYRSAFEIAAANRAAGHKPTGFFTLLRMWRTQKRLLASYPAND
ncbi:D-alanine--D-alanine ligase [Acidisoma cellulosilyticum]|uniref:D-alanine--D-alanine ligase n=1 Tax=Acidisoma cellulosilyticum TaxID=2802395 RepID=UPI001D09CB99|nr:D-alanine--D-alanine ligase [Acidisoma cellulosilyticum]